MTDLSWPASTYLVDHRHRLLFCPVPKVLCTNLKKSVLQLAGVTETHDHPPFNGCDVHGDVHSCANAELALGATREAWVLERSDYFKFAFVRNPWARLVSAYLDKVGRMGEQPQGPTRELIFAAQARHGERPDPVRRISFRRFVSQIVASPDPMMDEHWRPQASFLVAADFDFIGRFEQLDRDLAVIERQVGVPLDRGRTANTVGYAVADVGLSPAAVADLDSTGLDQLRVALGGFPRYQWFYPPDLRGLVGGRYVADVNGFGYEFDAAETVPQVG